MDGTVSFISGSMFAQKSKFLIEMIKICKLNDSTRYLVFKPTKDTRDGLYVRSRVFDTEVPALAWDNHSYFNMIAMFKYTVAGLALTNPDKDKYIFFDEIHFLTKYEVKEIVSICKKYRVNLVVSGLETSFKLEYFDATRWLKENADNYFFYHGDCNFCGEQQAVWNLLYDRGNLVTEGFEIHPGDSEYKVCCQKCMDEKKYL